MRPVISLLAALLVALPLTALAANSHVQSCSNTGSGTSITVSTCSTFTNGNLIICQIDYQGGGGNFTGMTDNGSPTPNTYNLANNWSGGGFLGRNHYAENIAGSPTTVTANFDASTSGLVLICHEVSGAATSSSLDQFSNAFSGGGTCPGDNQVNVGTITPTVDGTYIFAAGIDLNARTPIPGTAFTGAESAASYASEYVVQGTATSITGYFGCTAGTSPQMVGSIANFKAAAGGASEQFSRGFIQ